MTLKKPRMTRKWKKKSQSQKWKLKRKSAPITLH